MNSAQPELERLVNDAETNTAGDRDNEEGPQNGPESRPREDVPRSKENDSPVLNRIAKQANRRVARKT